MLPVAIVGYGHVGRVMHRQFPEAVLYDPFVLSESSQAEVNKCAVAFICVPTPPDMFGYCDTSTVDEIVGWLEAVPCIRSTVVPGTTRRLQEKYSKPVAFCPEYYGEGPTWTDAALRYADVPDEWPYAILSGPNSVMDLLTDGFVEAGVQRIWRTDDTTSVELAKYMENVWLAQQVTFANEFYEIAKVVGADYDQARTLWGLDPRVSSTHTTVIVDPKDPTRRGFSGKCLPKDLAAIVLEARRCGYEPSFLAAMDEANRRFGGETKLGSWSP